jgi:4'-phosphopantetheinyl transferase
LREVEVWPVLLEAPAEIEQRAAALLSPDERDRARAFRFDRHRRSFTLARAVLRTLLGRYLAMAPARIEFQYGPKGKPSVAALRFNASHSGDLALFAFAECEVGVDIERVRPVSDLERIAARFFTSEESSEIASLAEVRRIEAFFDCWTRKEAWWKATGEGLSALGRPIDPGGAWTFHRIDPLDGYVAALAVEDGRPVYLRPVVRCGVLVG